MGHCGNDPARTQCHDPDRERRRPGGDQVLFRGRQAGCHGQLRVLQWLAGDRSGWPQRISPSSIMPELKNSNLHRFSHTVWNPLSSNEPTEHWDEGWEGRFHEEYGRAPTEQDWWNYQFAVEGAGRASDESTLTRALDSLLHAARVTVKDGDARWMLGEVGSIGNVIRNLTEAFGGDVSRMIGGVTIKRTHASRWPLGFAWKPCGAWHGYRTIRINDSAFAARVADHVLTHELGHYFQQSRGLIADFRKATGGSQFNLLGIAQLNLTPYNWGGTPPNDWVIMNGLYEDFAASFETFVYHRLGRPIQENVMGSERLEFFSRFVQ